MGCHGGLAGDWWTNKDIFAAELEAHNNSNTAVARSHGCGEQVIRKWRKRHGIPPRPSSLPRLAPNIDEHHDDWLLTALKKKGDTASVEELADHADVSPRKVREALERLGRDGYRVEEGAGRVVLNRVPPPADNVHRDLFAGQVVRFGVVSDTHLGSKHERLEELHMAYDVFADEGIEVVMHPGDLVCGYGIFPGQNNEVKLHTYQEQVEYAALNYPSKPGIETLLISGNHDAEGAWGKAGANPCVAVANQRTDIKFMGDYRASIELDQGTRLYMLHPKGSMGYSADYKLRKLAEGFEGGQKPNVMLVGHFHRRGAFEVRSIQMLMCGCFESGGSFGLRLGLSDPAVGFHIVTMTVADDGSVVRFVPEWYRFYPGRGVRLDRA